MSNKSKMAISLTDRTKIKKLKCSLYTYIRGKL